MMPSPFIWTMPELSKIDDLVFFFFSSSFTCRMSARTHVSSVLPSCNMTTVPIRRVTEKERTTEEEKKRKKKEEESQQQNRVQLTGQILEPMKQVCVCVHSFSRSLSFSMSCTRTSNICLFFILFDAKRTMCVNIEDLVGWLLT